MYHYLYQFESISYILEGTRLGRVKYTAVGSSRTLFFPRSTRIQKGGDFVYEMNLVHTINGGESSQVARTPGGEWARNVGGELARVATRLEPLHTRTTANSYHYKVVPLQSFYLLNSYKI